MRVPELQWAQQRARARWTHESAPIHADAELCGTCGRRHVRLAGVGEGNLPIDRLARGEPS